MKSGSFPDRPYWAEAHPKGTKVRPRPDPRNGTQLAGVADEGAAAQRSLLPVDDDFRLRPIDAQAVAIDPIQAPLARVAVHVEQPQIVRLQRPDREHRVGPIAVRVREPPGV